MHASRQDAAEIIEHAIDNLGFRGLKLYPRMGFPPDAPVLMDRIYPLASERNLPVISHCSRGGVIGKHISAAKGNRFTEPDAFLPVLSAFPGLRVCLAHFGGTNDWRAYMDEGFDPEDPGAKANNWQVRIRQLIGSGEHEGLWTDVSYTLFQFDDFAPFLRVFLSGDDLPAQRLRRRVLFGSDFYMTRQERLSERAVCFRLRNALGEALFHQIAVENPRIWLGEQAAPPLP